jgi:hypothetical protein
MKTQKDFETDLNKVNEEKLLWLIQVAYPASEYIVLDQVRSDTSNRARVADAIALGMWKSRSLSIEGFEFKASRASWLLELKKPQKAEEIAQYCDYWWLVASDETVVRRDELPENWGLYIAGKHNDLKKAVPAPLLKSKEPDRVFICCLLKRILEKKCYQEASREDLIKEYKRGQHEGLLEGERRAVEGKDAMIEWLNGELYRKNMKLESSEEFMKAGFNISPAELAMWGQVIREFNTPKYKTHMPANDIDRVRKLLEAVMFLRNAPTEVIEKRFKELKSAADQLARVIGMQLEDLKLLTKVDPDVLDDNPNKLA